MYKILAICLLGSGCSTIAPQTMNFPTPPELLMRPPSKLQTLPKRLLGITASAKKTPQLSPPYKIGSESSQELDE